MPTPPSKMSNFELIIGAFIGVTLFASVPIAFFFIPLNPMISLAASAYCLIAHTLLKGLQTPMFPAQWKVKPVGEIGDNATYNYFRTLEEAIAERDRRNKKQTLHLTSLPSSIKFDVDMSTCKYR